MGRRPNPLIGRYFERGAKLPDNSNRYQHTCRACGEHFPKGRVEVLLSHLLKKCPSLSVDQRQALVLEAHDLSSLTAGPVQQDGGHTQNNTTRSVPTPFVPAGDTFNALNVLAEASRQVGTDQCRRVPDYTPADGETRDGLPLDPSLDADSFASSFLNISEDNVAPRINTSFDSTAAPVTTSFQSSSGRNEHPSSQVPSSSITEAILSSQGPDLESIAASANDMINIDSDIDLSHGSIAEELLLENPHSVASKTRTDSLGQAVPCSTSYRSFNAPCKPLAPSNRTPTMGGSSGSLRRLAMHPSPKSAHFIAESGTATKSPRPKVRGKFTPERRKEVKDIRTMGACLRCRVLKKTCSGGSPCQACAAIETPRVWKHRCIRTKLVNEFSLFSVGLASTLSYHEISSIKENTKCEPFDGYVRAFIFDNSSHVITFKALQSQTKSQGPAIGANTSISQSPIENECGCFLVEFGNDDAAFNLKVDQYLTEIHSSLVSAESSPILKCTLETAHSLLADQSDSILARAVELWSTVLVLVDPSLNFTLILHPGPIPESAASAREPNDPGLAITAAEWPRSFQLVNSQLRAIVDKRAGSLANGITVDMERRLMQKPHDNKFHIFIASVLLLNCVERMSWDYGRWQFKPPGAWPLDKGPEAYAQEGDGFADVLDSLLDMRAVPPKTTVDPKTKIIIPEDPSDEVVRMWFKKIAITPEFLKVASDRPFLSNDCRSLDMKLFARFIRPNNGNRKVEKKES